MGEYFNTNNGESESAGEMLVLNSCRLASRQGSCRSITNQSIESKHPWRARVIVDAALALQEEAWSA
jgi:hypothetical protein